MGQTSGFAAGSWIVRQAANHQKKTLHRKCPFFDSLTPLRFAGRARDKAVWPYFAQASTATFARCGSQDKETFLFFAKAR
jgi:hypothetical protein